MCEYICPECYLTYGSLEACPGCCVPHCQNCLEEHAAQNACTPKSEAEREMVPVANVFYDPPRMEGDDRQKTFGAALDQIFEEEGYESATINLIGFQASRVDLGWLHDRIHEYWWRECPTPERAKVQTGYAMRDVVQRLKYWEIEVTTTHVGVALRTKDDHSRYTYSFSIYIAKDTRPDGRPQLRAVKG